METADSMKSRGYGLPGRTAFSLYRYSRRDRLLLLWLALCGAYVAAAGRSRREVALLSHGARRADAVFRERAARVFSALPDAGAAAKKGGAHMELYRVKSLTFTYPGQFAPPCGT